MEKHTCLISELISSINQKDQVRIGDELIEDKGRIQNGILEYYQQIYKEAESWRPSVVFENMSTLSIEENEELELPFTELEISNALMACTLDKAPGPDVIPWLSSKYMVLHLRGYTSSFQFLSPELPNGEVL